MLYVGPKQYLTPTRPLKYQSVFHVFLELYWSDRVFALKDCGVIADGPADSVLSETVLRNLYGIDVAVNTVNAGGSEYRVCTPFGG